jgi:hypothetical protein
MFSQIISPILPGKINTTFDHKTCTAPQRQALLFEERGQPLAWFPNRRDVYAACTCYICIGVWGTGVDRF